jgi:hypothetical protein
MGYETEAELRHEVGLRSRALSARRPCTSELLRIPLPGTSVNKRIQQAETFSEIRRGKEDRAPSGPGLPRSSPLIDSSRPTVGVAVGYLWGAIELNQDNHSDVFRLVIQVDDRKRVVIMSVI